MTLETLCTNLIVSGLLKGEAFVIKMDGTIDAIQPEGKKFTNAEICTFLECDGLERVDFNDEVMPGVCGLGGNDVSDEAINRNATHIWRKSYGIVDPYKAWNDMVEGMGDELICAASDREPFTLVGNIVICHDSMY